MSASGLLTLEARRRCGACGEAHSLFRLVGGRLRCHACGATLEDATAFARCSCKATYSEEAFLALSVPGTAWQTMPPDLEADYRPEGYRLQYRNCKCGSTIAVERPLSDVQPLAVVQETL